MENSVSHSLSVTFPRSPDCARTFFIYFFKSYVHLSNRVTKTTKELIRFTRNVNIDLIKTFSKSVKYSFHQSQLWGDLVYCKVIYDRYSLELVSKELNHLAAILHVYAGGFIFIK